MIFGDEGPSCVLAALQPSVIEEKGEGFENGKILLAWVVSLQPQLALRHWRKVKLQKNAYKSSESEIRVENIDLAYT